MYRRLVILSLIIVVALVGLSWLGYRAISVWSQGIEGTRITEFANVAEQIRSDVNDKLDAFKEREQNRPYTDYQYYTIPEESLPAQQTIQANDRGGRNRSGGRGGFGLSQQTDAFNNLNQQFTVVRSPLADNIEHDLAYFNFQVDEETNAITSPNGNIDQQQAISTTEESEKLNELVESNVKNVRDNLLPVLDQLEDEKPGEIQKEISSQKDIKSAEFADSLSKAPATRETEQAGKGAASAPSKSVSTKAENAKRTGNYNIESLQNINAEPQVQTQSRNFIMSNSAQNELGGVVPQGEFIDRYQQQEVVAADEENRRSQQQESMLTLQERQEIPQSARGGQARGAAADTQIQVPQNTMSRGRNSSDVTSSTRTTAGRSEQSAETANVGRQIQLGTFQSATNQADTVEVTIEPFVTVVVPGGNNKDSIFGGQVFMIRRVKYEGKELIQGFQLNEKRLLEEVEKSTQRFMRDGMSYEMSRNPNAQSAYTAVLDFVGFGRLFLNLFETDPGRLALQISHLRIWYFSILSLVFLAVTFAVVSLWLNAQIRLAQKKDDFVSAVSHELRTPLTSIRMHAEMLEKNWIKSESKLSEYYRSMRAESERLSRLIENVLDFSRIQKGRKKYVFKLGDINKCVVNVVEMMTAYASQKGFRIRTELDECREVAFDSDAVTQIVVNLLDNAVKYSGNSEDKTITVRTKTVSRDSGLGSRISLHEDPGHESRVTSRDYVLIEVEDHGPGIPHRQRKRIFQEFYRIGAEATRETAGSGLGLALVKRFVQAHNGFVEIISAKPTGSIFRVALAMHHN